MKTAIQSALKDAQSALDALIANHEAMQNIASAGHAIGNAFQNNNRVFACGNGGSMCDAMHFAEELSGRFRGDRPALGAVAISDPGHISCVSNDYGYQHIFSRYIQAHGRAGDVLLGISTSGNSENVVLAAKAAKAQGLHSIILTGQTDSTLAKIADIPIITPAGEYADRIQELHIKVLHILIELTERQLFPDNYAAQ